MLTIAEKALDQSALILMIIATQKRFFTISVPLQIPFGRF